MTHPDLGDPEAAHRYSVGLDGTLTGKGIGKVHHAPTVPKADDALTLEQALGLVLSDLIARVQECLRAKDWARAFVWVEVGLLVALQGKTVKDEIANATRAHVHKIEEFTQRREVRVRQSSAELTARGQFGRVVTAQGEGGLVLVRLDSGTEVWLEPKDLEIGHMVAKWEPVPARSA